MPRHSAAMPNAIHVASVSLSVLSLTIVIIFERKLSLNVPLHDSRLPCDTWSKLSLAYHVIHGKAMLRIASIPLLPSFVPGGQLCLYIRAASSQFPLQLARVAQVAFPKGNLYLTGSSPLRGCFRCLKPKSSICFSSLT